MMSANGTEHHLSPSITNEQLAVIRAATIITAVLGAAGNAITIVAILKGRLLQSNASFAFILNLNVCNLIHCLIFQTLLAFQAFTDVWTYHKGLCIAYAFGLFTNMGTELWGYTLITVNRYICVVHHLAYMRVYGNNKTTYGMLLFSWLFFPLIFLLPLTDAWGHFVYEPKKLVCYPFHGYNCTGFCLFIYILCLAITIPVFWFCYPAIIFKYIKTQRKVGVSREKSTTKTDKIIAKTDGDRKRTQSELKMAFTILAVVTVFGTCRLPFMILYMYDPSMTKVSPMIHTVLIHVGSSSNWINPVIYSLTNKAIFDSLKKVFTSWKQKFIVQT